MALAYRIVARRLRLLKEWATVRLPEILFPSPMDDDDGGDSAAELPRARADAPPRHTLAQHLKVLRVALHAYWEGNLGVIQQCQEELDAAARQQQQQQQQQPNAGGHAMGEQENGAADNDDAAVGAELRDLAHASAERAGEAVRPVVREVVQSRGAVFRDSLREFMAGYREELHRAADDDAQSGGGLAAGGDSPDARRGPRAMDARGEPARVSNSGGATGVKTPQAEASAGESDQPQQQ